uniref:AAA+ ATPase domain-containing protein n=1 Tax=Chlamydomonas euryale TaxID=1486919 RepID=A0A7R9YTI7_9CHLO|mmetsp:Transcript_21345/g.63967  ORF Transcript_21345/g.63967 Transcript_21345/m.63967 type:complete len:402 (+) Transcript_21345:1811-3016(+)
MVACFSHPAKVLDNSLEAHVLRSDNSSLAKDCRKEMKSLNCQLMRLENWKRAERRQVQGELRKLAKEERKRQQAAIVEVLKSAQVVTATLTGALHHSLEGSVFDVVVIDEAAQALEAACWGALLKAPRCVLAGDHLQLPPTIISDIAARRGLARTLFERIQDLYGAGVSQMLNVQYRMNKAIMQWSSDELYDGHLTAHNSVAEHCLADLLTEAPAAKSKKPAKVPSTNTGSSVSKPFLPVLLLIDTTGCGFEEQQEEEGDSRTNLGEAKAVIAHVERLIAAGIAPESIGIITPYNAQVALLKELRPDSVAKALEVSSVDGFQGREKEAIVISAVRCNAAQQVGFLADRRRMNVAVTRARRHCAIVCDTETLSGGDPFLGRLVSYFEQHGEYISAAELVSEA